MDQINDQIPYVWPQNKFERAEEIRRIQDIFENADPNLEDYLKIKRFQICTQGPYLDLNYAFGPGQHPLEKLLEYLALIDENQTTKMVKRVCLEDLDSSDELESYDPYQQDKYRLGLRMMNKISFPKLQKMLCDMYRIGNQKIPLVWIEQIELTDYLKTVVSCFKKISIYNYLNTDTFHFIGQRVKYGFDILNETETPSFDKPKYSKLYTVLTQIDRLGVLDIESLLSCQHGEPGRLIDLIWTRQQVIQAIVYYCVITCENNISQNEKSNSQYQGTLRLCTDDWGWIENCFVKISDHMPKLAWKLQDRYLSLRDLPIYDMKTRMAIFYYAQQYLGYYQHGVVFRLDKDLKELVENILKGEKVQCDLALIVLVQNAKMFVQLIASLYQI
ncbi:hypothetical protein pb186bvf_003423 [Paramecium bursaria]